MSKAICDAPSPSSSLTSTFKLLTASLSPTRACPRPPSDVDGIAPADDWIVGQDAAFSQWTGCQILLSNLAGVRKVQVRVRVGARTFLNKTTQSKTLDSFRVNSESSSSAPRILRRCGIQKQNKTCAASLSINHHKDTRSIGVGVSLGNWERQ
jgi:hypothetical protein